MDKIILAAADKALLVSICHVAVPLGLEGGVRQLVYLSRATSRLDEPDIDRLLESSQRNNRRLGVTGLLLFDGTRFIQALEGVADAVSGTMQRICSDARHDNIQVVSELRIAEREFTRWSMQYRCTIELDRTGSFVDAVKQDVAAVASPLLQALFIGFAKLGAETDGPVTLRTNEAPIRIWQAPA